MPNQITVIGNLTDDPFIGDTFVRIKVADNALGKMADKYGPMFYSVGFGNDASCAPIVKDLHKGDGVTVIGQLREKAGKDGKMYKEILFAQVYPGSRKGAGLDDKREARTVVDATFDPPF